MSWDDGAASLSLGSAPFGLLGPGRRRPGKPWLRWPLLAQLRLCGRFLVGPASQLRGPWICEPHLGTPPSLVPTSHPPTPYIKTDEDLALSGLLVLLASEHLVPKKQETAPLTLALPRKSIGARCSRCHLWGRKTSPLGTHRGCSETCFWRKVWPV